MKDYLSPKSIDEFKQLLSTRGHYRTSSSMIESGSFIQPSSDRINSPLEEKDGLDIFIYCPTKLDLMLYPMQSQAFYASIVYSVKNRTHVTISLEALQQIPLDQLVFLYSVLSIKRKYKVKIRILPPISQKIKDAIQFLAPKKTTLWEGENAHSKDAEIVISKTVNGHLEFTSSKHYTSRKRISNYAYRTSTHLEKTLAEVGFLENEAKFLLNTAYLEAILNCWQHAYNLPGESHYVTAHHRVFSGVWSVDVNVTGSDENLFSLSVLDFGDTIPETIRSSLSEGNHDNTILKKLTEERISSTNSYYRGWGFQDFLNVARRLPDFNLSVLSGREYLWYDGNEGRTEEFKHPFPGTFIQWSTSRAPT